MEATIVRNGKELMLPRGADISSACLVCGEPAVGGAITRRLSAARMLKRASVGPAAASSMFWWDVITYCFSAVWFVVDFPARRKRVVKIGFCDRHRASYFLRGWGGILAWIAGLGLVAAAIFWQRLPDWLHPLVFIAGALLIVLAIYLRATAPGLKLVGETKEAMRVSGAGEGFLKAHSTANVAAANAAAAK